MLQVQLSIGFQTCLSRYPNQGSNYVLLSSIFCVVKRTQPVLVPLASKIYFIVVLVPSSPRRVPSFHDKTFLKLVAF